MGERGVLLDRQAKLDEDLAGQGDPGDLVPRAMTWTSTSIGSPLRASTSRTLNAWTSSMNGGALPFSPSRAIASRDVATSSGVTFGRGSLTRADFTRRAPGDSGLSLGQVRSTSAARITPIRAAFSWPPWRSAHFTSMWLMSPQQPAV